jgi:phage shock protein PspC (stress-responsive transcriptional regulator)
VTRIRDGRWLAGVCRGLAEARDLELAWLRLGFIALALLGGVGVAVYGACCLIMPAQNASSHDGRGAVWLAQALGACVALLVLALLGAVATVFGFGWVVFAVAAALLVGLLAVRRLGPAWGLLPVAALALPLVAVAASGISLSPRVSASEIRVASVTALRDHVYRSGLNTMLVDLRDTHLPARGDLTVHIHAGLRRTIVALPHDACVHVRVNSDIDAFPLRAASVLMGRSDRLYSDLFVFGQLHQPRGPLSVIAPAAAPGPTLTVDFSSEGGSLYVRDYPDSIDPEVEPDWPGYPVAVERRPRTAGEPKREARFEIRSWKVRAARDRAEAAGYNRLQPGPCAR